MSVWRDMHQRSNGIRKRKEDMDIVYFRLNSAENFHLNEEVTFNAGSVHECVGVYITSSRISRYPIFRLIKGNIEDVENNVTYNDQGFKHSVTTEIVSRITNFNEQ